MSISPVLASIAINDFSIQVATINGSGSQTANSVLMRALFQMGIPVSGKNLFPSNIAGLPTWFTIRASRDGYIARKKEVDFLVAMNPETAREDVASLAPGAAVVYDEPLKLNETRADLHFYPVPFDKLVAPVCPEARLRKLVRNMIYDGVVAHLLGIDMEEVRRALLKQFGTKKAKAAELNWNAVVAGRDFAAENLGKSDRFAAERMASTAGKIIIDGNAATALGCMFAGVTVVTWYPITPSSSLAEAFSAHCHRLRRDPETKQNKFAIIQAEDELASIGVVVGAGWNGSRAFTATSGPGISLMQEFIGLAYFAEIPAVIFDIQRGSPSTGMPTRTQQADIISAAYASHGDTKHILLFPQDPNESFTFAADALDLADRLQTPVFVMMDLDIGMNDWLVPPLQWDPTRRYDRGKIMGFDDLDAGKEFGRYLDVDGDGIPYRTLPGTHPSRGAYFTRGTTKDRYARYSEEGSDYVDNMQRLLRKFETAKRLVPRPVKRDAKEATKYGAIYFGSSALAMEEALETLEARDIHLDTLRLRAFPFHDDVVDFISSHERVFVVEQNRDAQMRTLITTELEIDPGRLVPLLHYDGTPITGRFIVKAISDMLAVVTLAPLRKALP